MENKKIVNARGEFEKPLTIHIGNKLRLLRSKKNISQHKLAKILGVTFQQVQKYEKGLNRIASCRLYTLSKILNVNVRYFYEGFNENDLEHIQQIFDREGIYSITSDKENLKLIRAYNKIPGDLRKVALDLLKKMAAADNRQLPNN